MDSDSGGLQDADNSHPLKLPTEVTELSRSSSQTVVDTDTPSAQSEPLVEAEDDSHSAQPQSQSPIPAASVWKPGAIRRIPWDVAISFLIVIVSAIACAAIVILSDGDLVDSWQIRPSIWLALLAAAINTALVYAAFEGMQVYWWTRAIRGCDLATLQRIWLFGTSVWSAALSARYCNLIAIVTVAATLVALDGPLLQRASSTLISQVQNNVTVHATVANHLPFGYSGLHWCKASRSSSIAPSEAFLERNFQQLMMEYNSRRPIDASTASGCHGICKGTIRAAGFLPQCNEYTERKIFLNNITHFDPGTPFEVDLRWPYSGDLSNMSLFSPPQLFRDSPPLWQQFPSYPRDKMNYIIDFINFDVTFANSSISKPASHLNLTNSSYPYWATPEMQGLSGSELVHRKCILLPVTSEYPVTITNSSELGSSTIELTGKSTPIPGTTQTVEKAVQMAVPEELLENVYVEAYPPFFTNDLVEIGHMLEDKNIRPDKGLFRGGFFEFHETLSGIASAAQNQFRSRASLALKKHSEDEIAVLHLSGNLVDQFLRQDSAIARNKDRYHGLLWDDPTSHVLSALDEIMFRASINSAYVDTIQHLNLTYVGDGVQHRNFHLFPSRDPYIMTESRQLHVYKSHYLFLLLAMVLVLLTMLLISSTFIGYGSFGRPMTLTPLEILRAFGAPILEDAPSNANGSQLLKHVGGRKVIYGERLSTEAAEKARRTLLAGSPERILSIEKGALYE
jgi:hypothetical protein